LTEVGTVVSKSSIQAISQDEMKTTSVQEQIQA